LQKFQPKRPVKARSVVLTAHHYLRSVGATGGVYKGQGRNQCKLMTCVY